MTASINIFIQQLLLWSLKLDSVKKKICNKTNQYFTEAYQY